MLSHKEPTVVESLFQQVGEYAETRGALLKLTAVDKASELISLAAVRAAVFLIASVTILLLSIATAFLLGEWLGRYSYGFFIVTIGFALVGILVSLRSAKPVFQRRIRSGCDGSLNGKETRCPTDSTSSVL